jgi:hypothetical protein
LIAFLDHNLNYEFETVEYYKKLIEEGTKGLIITEFDDYTQIIQEFPDGCNIENKIPKLNLRNEVAISIWRLLQHIPQLTLFEAIDLIGVNMSRIDIYILTKKIVEINNIIQKHRNQQSTIKPGYIYNKDANHGPDS